MLQIYKYENPGVVWKANQCKIKVPSNMVKESLSWETIYSDEISSGSENEDQRLVENSLKTSACKLCQILYRRIFFDKKHFQLKFDVSKNNQKHVFCFIFKYIIF